MLVSLAIALTLLSAQEVPTLTIWSILSGAPEKIDRSLKVSCGGNIYSFKFSTLQNETSIEFEREPMQPSAKLSAEVIEAFRQFSGAPLLEAWCASGINDGLGNQLKLEATGLLQVSYREARENCFERGGMFDMKSLRIITIRDDVAYIDVEEIGKCTTHEDIAKHNRLTRGSVK